jgi:hypothetical protein
MFKVRGKTRIGPLNILRDAVVAYSLRRINPNYSGFAIRVRRTGDNAEQDIGFNSDGTLDQTAIVNFVGGNIGHISIWYDQSGNNTHQFRGINDGGAGFDRGPIILSGVIQTNPTNGLPAAYFDGSRSMISNPITNITSLQGEWSTIAVSNSFSSATRVLISSDTVGVRLGQFLRIANSNIYSTVGFNTAGTAVRDDNSVLRTNNDFNILFSYRDTSFVEIFVNNFSNGKTFVSGTPASGFNTPIELGYRNSIFSTVWQGYLQEVIHYNVTNINRYVDITNSINSYYRIF